MGIPKRRDAWHLKNRRSKTSAKTPKHLARETVHLPLFFFARIWWVLQHLASLVSPLPQSRRIPVWASGIQVTIQTCIISWRVARRPRQPWVRRPRSIACSRGQSLTDNFRHLQTHASIFPKRHSAQLRVSFTHQLSDAKIKAQTPKFQDVLSPSFFPLLEPPP